MVSRAEHSSKHSKIPRLQIFEAASFHLFEGWTGQVVKQVAVCLFQITTSVTRFVCMPCAAADF